MRKLSWSPGEKKIARAAFEHAYQRECEAIRAEVQSMLRNSRNPRVIWEIEDYLRERRRETDQKVRLSLFGVDVGADSPVSRRPAQR